MISRQRVALLEDYFANASKWSQQKFSNVPLQPGKQTLCDFRRRLRETGSVGDRPDSARTSALTVVFLIGTYSKHLFRVYVGRWVTQYLWLTTRYALTTPSWTGEVQQKHSKAPQEPATWRPRQTAVAALAHILTPAPPRRRHDP